jgi:hypothetical protein
MSDSFKLTVPVDERYRNLAPDVSAKYAELAGGTADDGKALSSEVNAAIEKLAHGAPHGAGVDLAFHVAAGRVEVQLQCHGRTAAVTHHMHHAKH